MDINPADVRAPTIKKKKRGGAKISIRAKGGNEKRLSAGATVEARFGRPSLSVGVGDDNIGAGPPMSKKEKHQRKERTHRDRERRSASKLTKTEEKVQSLVGVVEIHERREKDQAHLDKNRDARKEELLASEEKAKDTLKQRTERFDSSRKKKDAETKLQKSKLEVRIAGVQKENKARVEKVNKKATDNTAALKKKGEESLSKSKTQSARARKKQKVS